MWWCKNTDGFYMKDGFSTIPKGSKEINEKAKEFYEKYRDEYEMDLSKVKKTPITMKNIFTAINKTKLLESKMTEIDEACTNAIYQGFGVMFGTKHVHFTYTIHDQINIQEALSMPNEFQFFKNGKFWTHEEVVIINQTGVKFKTDHRKYCNELKHYISQLRDIRTIISVTYGHHISG